ncbi:M23 family metallopeptidase [Microlunatus sp. Y2014]|uniref:M23 family metallopeptidase n=1 Tax=Microlunatus sp. Y2014 TaxID=3418488 RepID=UPI003DA6F375
MTDPTRDPLDLAYPFHGRWLVRNSPANRVPSHGTALFGLSHAIDFVPVDDDGRSAPYTLTSLLRTEPPSAFTGFGRAVVSPIDGVVVGTHTTEPDHDSFRGLPSVGYALTQRRRLDSGLSAVIGNHVLVETTWAGGIAVVAVCHLQQGSVLVSSGDTVRSGQPIGRCGNSGNSTEPHVHLHALDSRDLLHSAAVPITFRGGLPHNGEVVEA